MAMSGKWILKTSPGFTLIEFLIAASIMSTGLLGMALLLGTGIQSTSLGDNTGIAVTLAQEKIEQLRNLPPENPARANGGSITSSLYNHYDTTGIHTRRWMLESGPAGSQICTVRVFGTTEDKRTRKQVDMKTIIR